MLILFDGLEFGCAALLCGGIAALRRAAVLLACLRFVLDRADRDFVVDEDDLGIGDFFAVGDDGVGFRGGFTRVGFFGERAAGDADGFVGAGGEENCGDRGGRGDDDAELGIHDRWNLRKKLFEFQKM